MTDSAALRGLIKESGLKYQFIAKKLGIAPYSLTKKIDNVTEFKAGEIVGLCDILHISDHLDRLRLFFTTIQEEAKK